MSELAGIKVLTGVCNDPPCTERLFAIVEERFGPAATLGGWVLTDIPLRRLDYNAKWRAKYYGESLDDHSGEHFVFTQCPWCGRDLPPPPDDEGLEQADGG